KTDYRNKAKRQRILETKATELEIGVDHLWTWFKSLRDMFTRLDKKKKRQPTPALSVSSDMETLQRKAKESGEMMTMGEQLPPPEQVTERTTYAAYVKSVLLGLSFKDFRPERR
ncbi:hypothetical protein NHX12_017187, partial [Muraenolepis orangiensis]